NCCAALTASSTDWAGGSVSTGCIPSITVKYSTLTRRSGHAAATPLFVTSSILSTRNEVYIAFCMDWASCGSVVTFGGGYTEPAGPVPFVAVAPGVGVGAAGCTNVPSLLKLEEESPPPGVQGL